MAERLDALIDRAKSQGLLPADARAPGEQSLPWPVLLLYLLGAQLVALPLLGGAALLLGDWLTEETGLYACAAMMLAPTVLMLRQKSLGPFLEMLALPFLLAGLALLAAALASHLQAPLPAMLLAALATGLTLAMRQSWLHVLLGALIALLLGTCWTWLARQLPIGILWPLLAIHLPLLAALAIPALQRAWPGHGAMLESVSTGWWLVVLAGFWMPNWIYWIGRLAMDQGPHASSGQALVGRGSLADSAKWLMPSIGACLALTAAVWLARRWPALRRPAPMVAGLAAVGLSWFIPLLGGLLLALAALVASHRWLLSAAAGVVVTWKIWAFYYALSLPLTTKAAMLAAAGACIGLTLIKTWPLPAFARSAPAQPAAHQGMRPRVWMLAGTIATLVVALGAIWQKQDLIAHGRPVYVQLAPVDPRSLMQGDYMRLRFALPDGVRQLDAGEMTERPKVVARLDARQVADVTRLAKPGDVLAADELLLELTAKGGDWTLVTDAWFFAEGQGARWEKARYGEFRVLPDGRALLVGMADEQLRAIRP